jgi:hypothetical protein
VGRFLRLFEPAAADVVAATTSDAQRFLLEAATVRRDEAAVAAQLERHGVWEETDASGPRITHDRIDRVDEGRYRASCDHHGVFSVEVAAVERALEAVSVLGAVQRVLLDAIEWGSWPDDRRRRPRTVGERYLRQRARDARKASKLLLPEMRRALKTPEGWIDAEPPVRRSIREVTAAGWKALRVEVAEDSLVLATHAASPDRALAFLALYSGLQRDLRHVLRWEPLPADGEV